MKQLVTAVVAVVLLAGCGTAAKTYERTGVVTASSAQVTEITDTTGNVWELTNAMAIGSEVTLKMNDNGTTDITDDIIEEVRQ